ncbi:hypothetical protein BDN72DRAFT_906543 [Pluteus cervinus]|uniref:Uncharacterized protein n=1 Tax=Pluteus cervinus TaxID=181527 RepID=A0ACD2ZZ53_9AGAR|nr:hypothetical protein BDN72DRAFT_906543 [Pluteus cervinus]
MAIQQYFVLSYSPSPSPSPSPPPFRIPSTPRSQQQLPRPPTPQPDVDLDDDEDDDAAPLTFDQLPVAVDNLIELKLAQELVVAIRNAELTDDIDEEAEADILHALKNPRKEPIDIDPDLQLSLQLYNAMYDCSGKAYERVRAVFNSTNNSPQVISYDFIKKAVVDITGVRYIKTDMCPNSCYAFTGPWVKLDNCPKCGTSRWDPIKTKDDLPVTAQQFSTIPIGFKAKKTLEELKQMKSNCPDVIEDIYQSTAYLNTSKEKKIGEHDPVLMFTLDGAQLYQNKRADCWFFFWIILNLPLELHYKKQFIIPAGFVPGPNKPENIALFGIPSWRHCAALSSEGLKIWDGDLKHEVVSRPFVYNAGFDTVAGPVVTGGVGHNGHEGWREFCGMCGRRKDDGTVYYPVALKPNNFNVPNSSHADVDLATLGYPDHHRYMEKLAILLASQTNADYERNRFATGLVRPSPFLGFSSDHSLPPPEGFPLDLMHLGINLAELLIPLWCGEVRADGLSIADCEHAFLVGDAWKDHGHFVERTRPYLPSSFNRAPRNPALKINSGFKAWEYMLYLWSLGPAVFRPYLGDAHWKNFCKLVQVMRTVQQRRITHNKIFETDELVLEWEIEFEELYYQRNPQRLHFVRPCVHLMIHAPMETLRVSPLNNLSQWSTENSIGNLTREIRQHKNPFANLTECGIRRAQLALIPQLVPASSIPQGAVAASNGYILLPAFNESIHVLSLAEASALNRYLVSIGHPLNAQANLFSKIRLLGKDRFGEVQYFFQYRSQNVLHTVAMLSIYTYANSTLLRESLETLYACRYTGTTNLHVIKVQDILSVVGMPPLPHKATEPQYAGYVYVAEKPFLEATQFMDDEEED